MNILRKHFLKTAACVYTRSGILLDKDVNDDKFLMCFRATCLANNLIKREYYPPPFKQSLKYCDDEIVYLAFGEPKLLKMCGVPIVEDINGISGEEGREK